MKLKMFKESPSVGIGSVKRIVAVVSGKGGVGKSTLTASLAVALKEKGYRVGVLDADLYGPSIDALLPKDQAAEQGSEGISPAHCKGIRLVSMAYLKAEGGAAIIRAPIANQLLKQFLSEVKWGELDYLLLDFPPGTGDIQLTLAQLAPIHSAILVTQPQKLSKIDVYKAWEMLTLMHIPLLGYVENMAYFKSPEGNSYSLFPSYESKAGSKDMDQVPLLARLPLDPCLSQACDEGRLYDLNRLAPSFYEEMIGLGEKLESYFTQESQKKVQVKLLSPETLQLIFPEGEKITWKASELQSQCPCSYCTENPPTHQEGVRFTSFQLVGHYGVRFLFSRGCDKGIYHFDRLKSSFKGMRLKYAVDLGSYQCFYSFL